MSDIHQNDVAVGLHLVVTTRTMADASREFGPLLSKLEPKRCALHRSSGHGHHEFDLLTGTTGSATRRTLHDMETWSDRVLTSLGLASDYHILFDPDEGWTVEDCSKSPEEAALIHPSCIHYHLRATIGFDPWDVDSR